jgi:serine/threonine-protein kinase
MRRVSQRLILVLLLCPAVAVAAEYFGAIAYSQGKRAHGWGKDYPSRQQAEKAALANCAKYAEDCSVVVWFKNACGALSLGPKGAGWAWAHKQSDADRAATRACAQHSNACTVTQRMCTKR